MISEYEITGFDIEVIGNIVRGLTFNPDLVDDGDLEKIVQLMNLVSTASIYSS